MPERIAGVTEKFFGIKGLIEGNPRLSGIMGAIIAVHAAEKVSSGAATTALRLFGQGQPLAKYRGILIRRSPITPQTAPAWNKLSGGRLREAEGYYFSERGRSWHASSLTFQVGDGPRTLTRLQSLSVPQREFYFDRAIAVPGSREPDEGEKSVPVQRLVDLVKGEAEPDAIPGFIGSINELEGMTVLRGLKRKLFLASWLMVDPDERDGGGADYVDYDALARGGPTGGGTGGVYRVTPRSPGPPGNSPGWPTTRRVRPQPGGPTRVPVTPPPRRQPYGTDLFRSRPSAAPRDTRPPAERYRDRIRLDGRDYPLVVQRVNRSLSGGPPKADALYYDDRMGRWRVVVEEEDRINLARAVKEGRLSLVDEADWPRIN